MELKMTKDELHKKFINFLDNDFSKEKDGLAISRWILCMDGGVGERECDCLWEHHNELIEIDGCTCSCHSRVNEIIDFFWKLLVPDNGCGIDTTPMTPTLPRNLQFVYDGEPIKLKSLPYPASSGINIDEEEMMLMDDMINNPIREEE